MNIGLFVGATATDKIGLTDLVQQGIKAEEEGFDSFWLPNIRGHDALIALSLIGAETERISLGSAVVPTYPRHPSALAQQALSAQTASGGRFILGVGPSHKPQIEDRLGLSYDKPAKHTREYITALRGLVSNAKSDFTGEFFNLDYNLEVTDSTDVPIMISALAPAMLRLAGEVSDGTITWMAGVKAIESHVVPRINKAAENVGRSKPRVVVGLPLAVSDDKRMAIDTAASAFERYGTLVNYRRILEAGNVEGASEVAVIGNEKEVEAQLKAFADAGATDFIASIFPVGTDQEGSKRRSQDLLRELVGKINV